MNRPKRWPVRLAVLIATLFGAASAAAAQTGPVVIKGGHYFDVHTASMVPNHGIRVLRGRIMEIAAESGSVTLEDAKVIELDPDEYILPGLIDLHAHYNVNLDGTGRWDETVVNPVVYLANGVTATFPAGEYDPERMLELRRKIDRDEAIGPRILSSGPYFGTARPGWNPRMTKEEIFAEVDLWAERGVAGFKAKGIGPDHLEALIERAHLHGLTVTGHLDSGFRNTVNAADAIMLGIDRVEHILGGGVLSPDSPAYPLWIQVDLESEEFQEIVSLFLEHRV